MCVLGCKFPLDKFKSFFGGENLYVLNLILFKVVTFSMWKVSYIFNATKLAKFHGLQIIVPHDD